MTRHPRVRGLRGVAAFVASAAMICAAASSPAHAWELASSSGSSASASASAAPAVAQVRKQDGRSIIGWAGLTQDAPLSGARVRIISVTGADITKQVTGFSAGTSCTGAAKVMCTQRFGVIHIPLLEKVPAGAILVVSGGSILGKKMTGSLRVRMEFKDGEVQHPTVTLGSTVMLALEKTGLGSRESHRRTLAALGLHRGYSVGFSERHDSGLLDMPGVVGAFTRLGAAGAVQATVRSALAHPREKASWLARAEKVPAPRAPRDFEWTASGVGKWAAGQLAGGIVGAIGSQAFSLFLGAVGYDPQADRLRALQDAIEKEMDKGFADIRNEMNTGFQTLSNLVNTQGSAAACQDAKNLVSTGVGQIVSSLSTADYQEAWNKYVTAVVDETPSQSNVQALLSHMSSWSTATGSGIGLKAYQNAFSPVGGIVSSTSIAAAWQQDLQCLRGSAGDATLSPLITAQSWPTTDDTASPVVPVSVQLGTYYTGVAARGALLDAVFAAFVQACGTRPTADGTCPTGAKGATTITTNDTWSKVYKSGCDISPSQQVGCAGVNYYATIAGSLIEPVGDGVALDYRTGNWWSMANVIVDNLDPSKGDFDISSEVCAWRAAKGWSDCPTDFAMPTRAQLDVLVASQGTVKPLGSSVTVNSVGMPSTVTSSSPSTYADVLHSWYSYSPSADMAANGLCGSSRGTSFTDSGVQRTAPGGGVMGFTQANGDGATCTGSWGVLVPEYSQEVICPAAIGVGSQSGIKWNIHAYDNDFWYTREDYQGNSLAMGFGHPQPSSGNACAGWAYVDPPTLSNWWGLLPTGDYANVAADPFTVGAVRQYMLDGTTTASAGFVKNVQDSGHDPDNYGNWQVSPRDGYYAAARYIRYSPPDLPLKYFRTDITANAVAIWGDGVPLGFWTQVPTLGVRGGGWQPYLFQDSSAGVNETLCPDWDRQASACGSDGRFVPAMAGAISLDLSATPAPAAQLASSWLVGGHGAPVVLRRYGFLGQPDF